MCVYRLIHTKCVRRKASRKKNNTKRKSKKRRHKARCVCMCPWRFCFCVLITSCRVDWCCYCLAPSSLPPYRLSSDLLLLPYFVSLCLCLGLFFFGSLPPYYISFRCVFLMSCLVFFLFRFSLRSLSPLSLFTVSLFSCSYVVSHLSPNRWFMLGAG